MKRVIFLLLTMMLLMPGVANAQIQKTGSVKTETIASVRMGFVSLRKSEGRYYISFSTNNQFDDRIILKLGDNKESAIQSLNDLIDILDSLQGNAIQYIDNGYGRELRLWKLMGALYISADGYAGDANTSKGELKKFLSALQK